MPRNDPTSARAGVSGVRHGIRALGMTAALLLLAFALAAACGGNDNNSKTDGKLPTRHIGPTNGTEDTDGTTPVLATFTATPPNFTPEVVQTRSAAQTAYAQTATAQPRGTSTAPPPLTIVPGTVSATVPPQSLKPPDAILVTSSGQATAGVGSYNWFDPRLLQGANITAPYVVLPGSGTSWATGTNAQVQISDSFYPVISAQVRIYTFDGNTAIPTDQAGNPSDTPAFYPQQPPLRDFVIQGADIAFAPEVPAGRCIVEVHINWSTPAGLESQLFTQYIFVVDVL